MQKAEHIIKDDLAESVKSSIILASSIGPAYYKKLGYEQLGLTHADKPFMIKITTK